MFVVAVALVILLTVSLYLLDRALKALHRGRRRRNVAERLYAAEAFAEAVERNRQQEKEAHEALTSVLPAIIEHGPRKVA
jgi:F0F1-type ATP synthase membrane subunit b/b'